MIEAMGLIAAVILPFWNIPLIMKIRQRRSSRDISLAWTVGVWTCFVVMVPSGLRSPDRIFQVFAVLNVLLFTAVLIQVIRYR